MAEMNIFEYAAKNKLRFPYRGMVCVEDLYDLSVEQLDGIYKTLKREAKARDEESLLSTKTKEDVNATVKIEIVKTIVNEKLEEKSERKAAADRRKQREKIMSIMAEKQDADLREKSPEELQKLLDDLQ